MRQYYAAVLESPVKLTRREILLLPILAACNAAHEAEAFHVPIPLGSHYIYIPRSLHQTIRNWIGQAAFEHYQIWELNFGPYRQQRRVNIYIHDVRFLVGPFFGVGITAYTVEGNGPYDEIHAATGIKYTLPGLMSQFHQVSLWPRDYPHRDPIHLADWLQIEGPLKNTGLQLDVVNYFLARR